MKQKWDLTKIASRRGLKVLPHKVEGRSECFAGPEGLPRPSHFPIAFSERSGTRNYSFHPETFLLKAGGSHHSRIDNQTEQPKQKRPSPIVKAAFLVSGQPDLNRRPRRPERRALPDCAMPRVYRRSCYRADWKSRSAPTHRMAPPLHPLARSSMVIHTNR